MNYHFRIVLMVLVSSFAYANLQVFPTRIVLTQKDKSAQISLRNKGIKKTKYRVSTIFYEMTPDGSLKELKDSKKQSRSAAPFMKYSPHLVELEPNEEQVVRILLKPTAEMTDGDYRVHLLFESTDDSDAVEGGQTAAGATTMNLKAKLAIAVPVVIKYGQSEFKVSLDNLELIQTKEKQPAFSVDMVTEGNGFPFGDFKVYFQQGDEKENLVGEVNGISSYIKKRKVSYPLDLEKFAPGKSGKLRVEFRIPEGESSNKIAETVKVIK